MDQIMNYDQRLQTPLSQKSGDQQQQQQINQQIPGGNPTGPLPEDQNILEMEHAIGFSGKIPQSVYLHPDGQHFIYISGGCIVINSMSDPHDQQFLKEHDDQITCLAISHNGRMLASGQKGDNSDVLIWDYEQKRMRYRLSEHDFMVSLVEFSDDDRLLFSCGNSQDKKLFIWDSQTGCIVASYPIQPDPIQCMKWGGFVKDIKGRDTQFYQFATAGNRQLFIWSLEPTKGILRHEMINTGATIRDYLCMDFSKNRQDYLFAGTSSGDFCVFQLKSKALSHIITVSALGVTGIKCIDPMNFCVGCGNGFFALYTVDQNKLILVKKEQLIGAINSISCNNNSSIIMMASDKGFIYQGNPQTWQFQLQSENHVENILDLTYPPGISDKFASCSQDGTIRLWDVSEYIVTTRCQINSAGAPNCLTYNEEIILSGWQDGRIRMLKTETGQPIWFIDNAHRGGVTGLSFPRNNKFVCSGGMEGEVRVWEMRSREMISHLKEHINRVTKVKLIQNDAYILSSSRDRALLLWDLKTEKRISAHYQRMGGINSFDTVGDSSLVITTGQDRKITYWDLKSPNPIRQFDTSPNQKQSEECQSVAVQYSGKMFITGGQDQVVKLWDFAEARLVAEGTGHSAPINSVAWSYDDKQAISGGAEGAVFLWNVFV